MTGDASGGPRGGIAGETIEEVALGDEITRRYLTYAISTIVSRSLPDARDGLKPVHRRLLYAMRQLRLDAEGSFKKCARVVGDVIGRLHPHGDAAVYEALVRLARDFSLRYPLVEGQGNFGTLDGDAAAAMRYTEARLTVVAEAMLDGLDEDAVDFRATYDAAENEPVVLPAGFPNLLANGANGIAVGMATSIPPHNAAEIAAALRHLLADPRASTEDLLQCMPGPDFPTGGVMIEPLEARLAVYRSGRGSFRLRARWHEEQGKRGEPLIVVTEIPYQVQKAKLIEQLAALVTERRADAPIADLADESAQSVRIVLRPRDRRTPAAAVIGALSRMSDLEVRIGVNMNVLDAAATPRMMGLKDLLGCYLDHRREVLLRRSRYRQGRIETRLSVLAALIIAHLNIDEVIRIVREEDAPKQALMQRFALDDAQAEAVLNMRLRQLHRLDEIELRREQEGLQAERDGLAALLVDAALQNARIDAELAELARRFGPDTPLGRRRTSLVEALADDDAGDPPADAGSDEPVTLLLSQKGWLRVMAGHGIDSASVRYKEGDTARFMVTARRRDRLLLFAENGRCYTLACDRATDGKGFGEALRLLIELPAPFEPVGLAVLRGDAHRMLVATTAGRGMLVAEADLVSPLRAGKQVLLLDDGDRARRFVAVAAEDDRLAVIGSNRRLLVFPLADLPVQKRGRGVVLQRYREGGLVDATTFAAASGLRWRGARGSRVETELATWLGRRGGSGATAPRGMTTDDPFRRD